MTEQVLWLSILASISIGFLCFACCYLKRASDDLAKIESELKQIAEHMLKGF